MSTTSGAAGSPVVMTTPAPPFVVPQMILILSVQLTGSAQCGGLDGVMTARKAREGGVDSAVGQASVPRQSS